MEVLMAMLLILLALTPLITPHVQLAQTQNSLIRDIEYNHFANLAYADVYEKLLLNRIPFESIQAKEVFEIDPENLPGWEKSLPLFRPQFHLEIKKEKGDVRGKANLILLTITLVPRNASEKPLHYAYQIFVFRSGGLLGTV